MNNQHLITDQYIFEYILSILGNQRDICRVGATCKLWRTFAQSQRVWCDVPVIINSYGIFLKFLQAIKNGLIPHVLNSKSLIINLQYPDKNSGNGYELDNLPEFKSHIYSWCNYITSISIKIIEDHHVYHEGDTINRMNKIDKILLDILSNCKRIENVDVVMEPSNSVAKVIHLLCEEYNIQLKTLHVYKEISRWVIDREDISFIDDISFAIKQSAQSLLSVDVSYNVFLLPVVSQYCATTLQKLRLHPKNTRYTIPMSKFTSLDELVMDNIFDPTYPQVLDLETIGKTIRILEISIDSSSENSMCENIGNWLQLFTNVQYLKLHIKQSNDRYISHIDFSSLIVMTRLTSMSIEFDSVFWYSVVEPTNIIMYLAKTPIKQLVIKGYKDSDIDKIALAIGKFLPRRLSLLHFIDCSLMTTQSAEVVRMAIDTSAPNASFSVTVNKYRNGDMIATHTCLLLELS